MKVIKKRTSKNIFSISMKASFLISLFFFGCKEAKKREQELEKNNFTIQIEIEIPTNEELIVYYKDGKNQWFVEKKAIWRNVKGSKKSQKVIFTIPNQIVPNDFRIDIGRNVYKGLSYCIIKSIAIGFQGRYYVIPENKVLNYFNPNQFIIYDKKTKIFKFSKDAKGNYDPFFESKETLYPLLVEVVMGS